MDAMEVNEKIQALTREVLKRRLETTLSLRDAASKVLLEEYGGLSDSKAAALLLLAIQALMDMATIEAGRLGSDSG